MMPGGMHIAQQGGVKRAVLIWQKQMKRWLTIIIVALVVVCALADLIREFYANDTINYFASEPRRLLYVAAIAVAGGLLALAFSRLSGQAQRSVRLFGWGAAASWLTAFCGYAFYQSAFLSPVIVANSGAGVQAAE